MPDHFTPVERALNVHRVEGCVGPKASVNGLKNLLPVLRIVSQLLGCSAYSVLTMVTGVIWLSADQLVMRHGISIAYNDLSMFMNVQFVVKLPTVLSCFI
jgi:hypothetical protein